MIASGFNRNHRINGEAGVVPEEFLVEYVVDRVDTTATVWMGLTAGCARCHDHKFDPLSQKQFFELYAFFHNVPEAGKDGRRGQPPPVIGAPTAEQQRALDKVQTGLAAAAKVLSEHEAGADARLATWLGTAIEPAAAESAALEYDLAGRDLLGSAKAGENHVAKPGKDTGLKLTAPEWVDEALKFSGRTWGDLGGGIGKLDRDTAFTFSVWLQPAARRAMPVLVREDDLANNRGYHVVLDEQGRVEFQLAYNDENNVIKVVTQEPVVADKWNHLTVACSGSGQAAGVTVAIGGTPVALRVVQDSLGDSLRDSEATLRVGGANLRATFVGMMRDLRFYRRSLTALEVQALAGRPALAPLLGRTERSVEEHAMLRALYAEHYDPERRRLREQVASLQAEQRALDGKVVKTMVMREMDPPRETFILRRGEYDKPADKVTAAVPPWLGNLPAGSAANRLGFAQWLVRPEHPLTARVAVNRLWQQVFGTGLVKTSEDFGSQGEQPSHPELLDWLAVAFSSPRGTGSVLALGWDQKAILKLILTSATWQQSSRAGAELRERDPENRLLARGPRFRLPAQMIRDQALATAGLLVRKVGGPSVKPYQPPGLWEEVSFQRKGVGTDSYKADVGDALYRRSLYTFWKRTVNPPTMALFDASGREVCNVRSRITNTPLQALALLNETTFVEAARGLAERMIAEGGGAAESRVDRGWRLAVGRAPSEREVRTLVAGLDHHRARFAADSAAVEGLLHMGERPVPPGVDLAELAAYAAVANTVLNLDEVITKE